VRIIPAATLQQTSPDGVWHYEPLDGSGPQKLFRKVTQADQRDDLALPEVKASTNDGGTYPDEGLLFALPANMRVRVPHLYSLFAIKSEVVVGLLAVSPRSCHLPESL
jgi:hypothetical protein